MALATRSAHTSAMQKANFRTATLHMLKSANGRRVLGLFGYVSEKRAAVLMSSTRPVA